MNSHTFHYETQADFMSQMDALLTKLRRPRMRPYEEVRAEYPKLTDTVFYNRMARFKGKIERELSPTGTRTVALFVTPELHAWLSK